MAGDWIKIQHATPDKPEIHKMAELLDMDPDAVTGKLIRVWIWADQQLINCNADNVTKAFLDRYTYVTGFYDAMLKTGWLIETESGVIFPNFERHNGKTAKNRALINDRVSRSRNADVTIKPLQKRYKSVTREEKRREEKIEKKEEKTIQKTKHLETVMMTQEEYDNLLKPWGTAKKYYKSENDLNLGIEILDNYIRSKEPKYKSHYAVLQGWVYDKVYGIDNTKDEPEGNTFGF